MSAATIHIPAQHVEAIRRSLESRRGDAEFRDEVEGLLAQLPAGRRGVPRPCELTGPRTLLWSAVYDALCSAAEQLAEDCNELWRGPVDANVARAGIADVGDRLELLLKVSGPAGR